MIGESVTPAVGFMKLDIYEVLMRRIRIAGCPFSIFNLHHRRLVHKFLLDKDRPIVGNTG
jgi:hypothetical protein